MQLAITAFANAYDKAGQAQVGELEDLEDMLTTHVLYPPGTDKRDTPAWSPARFEGSATDRAAVELSALVLDFDGADPDAASARWQAYRHVMHSTMSSTPASPRFRLVLPLARPVPAAYWRRVWAWAAERDSDIDPTCKNAGRVYFLPATTGIHPHFARRNPGPLLDLDAAALPEPPRPHFTGAEPPVPTEHPEDRIRLAVARWRQRADDVCRAIEPLRDGRRAAIQSAAYLLAGHVWLDPALRPELVARLTAAAVACGRATTNTSDLISATVQAGAEAPLPLSDLVTLPEPQVPEIDPDAPVVLKFGKLYFVRDLQNRYVETDEAGMPLHLRDRGDLPYASAKGAVWPASKLRDKYAKEARSVTVVFPPPGQPSVSRWDKTTGNLRTSRATRIEVTPKYEPDVQLWLDAGLAPNPPPTRAAFLDWLACLDLPQVCAGLYLQGAPGSGKSLLLRVVRGRFTGVSADLRDVCAGGWSEALQTNPVIYADEDSTPRGGTDAAISAGIFKEITGNSVHQSKERFRNTVEIDGVFRAIMASNRADLLRFKAFSTRDDYLSVVQRIRHVRFGPGGASVLRSLGGWERTARDGWHRPDGPVARHIAWLGRNRAVRPGPRFAVEGVETELHFGFLTEMPATRTILACLAGDILTKPQMSCLEKTDAGYLVDPRTLHRHWARLNLLSIGSRPPEPGKVYRSLCVLGEEDGERVLVSSALVKFAKENFELPAVSTRGMGKGQQEKGRLA